MMSKARDEALVRRAVGEMLRKLKRRLPETLQLTPDQRTRLLQELGTTESNVDTLLSLPEEGEDTEVGARNQAGW